MKIFCSEYIIDFNGTRAYYVAYPKTGNDNSAAVSASKLLRKPKIQAYIDLIKDDIAKQAGVTKLGLIKELVLMAYSNLPLIIEKYKKGGIDALTEDEQKVIVEYSENKKTIGEKEKTIIDSSFKLKAADKRGAIQDIMKAMGWNEAEKVDHTTKGEKISSPPIIVQDQQTADQLNKLNNEG